MRGINRGAFGPNLSNKIRRSRTGTFYQCRQCGASHQLARDARNCTHNQKEVCDECETRKYTMCPSCKEDGYTICRECCEYGPLPCEIWDSVEDEEEMDAESYGFCAVCDHIGMFRVEDLPVGPRWFCTEKHYAQYAGLPVEKPGYYGFEAESFNAEDDYKKWVMSKELHRVCHICNEHKITRAYVMVVPVRPADGSWPINRYTLRDYCDSCAEKDARNPADGLTINDEYGAEGEIEKNYYARFGDQRGGKEWGRYYFTWFDGAGDWKPIDEDTKGWDEDDFEEFREQKGYELIEGMLEDCFSGLYEAIETNQTIGDEEHYITDYQVRDEDGNVVDLDFYISWDEPHGVEHKIQYYEKEPLQQLEFYDAEDKKMNPLEKAEVSGVVSGATMEGLETLLAAEEKETVFELGEGRNYRVSHDPEKSYVCAICDATPAYLLACKDYDPAPWEFSEHLFCSDHLVELMFDEDNVACDEDFEAESEPPEKDDPLESWMEEDYHSEESDSHPSLYWFVKDEIMKILEHGDMTESDLATIVEMVATKAPLYMIDRGMKKAEELGDRPVWEVLKMSAITRIELEKMDDEAVFSEKLGHWASEQCNTEGCENETYYWDEAKTEPLEDGICIDCFNRPSDPEAAAELRMMRRWASEDEEWGVMKDSSSRQWYCYWCGEEYGKDRKGKLLAEKCFKTKCESDGTLTPYDKRYLQLHDFSEKFLWEFPKVEGANPEVKKTDRRGVAVEPHFDISTAPYSGLVADGPIGNAYDGFHYELNEESLKRLNQFVDDYNHANSTNIGFDERYHEKGYSRGVDLYFSIHPQSFEAEEDDYVEMMECPHCSEFGDGEIPTGVDIDRGDRWSPPTADITGWEMCEYCEGKGEVEDTPENQSIPTWDWDYLIPDEPDYDRYEDRYDDWDAESNGDRQLEESIKRTKMSAIRTGLAITTFGIVLWNLWTNKKQEKQISDIMGLV